jgi:hypothetical protein
MINSTMISGTTGGLLMTAPANFEDRVDRMIRHEAGIEFLPPPKDRADLDTTIRELDALMVKAALLRGYLDGRYGHGCGDQGHEDAVNEANKLVRAVRRALGFNVTPRERYLNF